MTNTFKKDLKRMFKMKSFYATMIISLMLMGLTLAGIVATGEFMGEMGASIKSFVTPNTLIDVSYVSGFALTMMSIFFAIIAVDDFGSGWYKNYIPQAGARTRFVVSKILIAIVYFVIQFLVNLAAAVVGTVLVGGTLTLQEGDTGVWSTFLHYFPYTIAFMMIVLAVSVWRFNKTTSIVVAVLLSMNIQGLIFNLLEMSKLLPFKLSDYSLLTQMRKSSPFFQQGDTTTPLIIAAAFFLVFSAFSVWRMNKADIVG